MLFGHFPGTLSLRQALNARSGATGVAVLGFGNSGRLTVDIAAPDGVASVTVDGKFAGRAQASGLRSFGLFATASRSQASFAPNHSFKPTPHRGVNSVLCATLHAVATPPRGGLTQALGDRIMINRESNPVGWGLLLYELADAHEHLGTLLKEISEHPDYSEDNLRVDLGHVYAHLNRAWFRRNVPEDFPESEWDKATSFPGDLEPVA